MPEDGLSGPADHAQTQAAALAAPRQLRDAADSGDRRQLTRLYRETRIALDEHERVGDEAIDRMAHGRHGDILTRTRASTPSTRSRSRMR